MTVNEYETLADDDMSFAVNLDGNTYSASAWDSCGSISGGVYVLKPTNSNFGIQGCYIGGGDYSPYSDGYEFICQVEKKIAK